MKRVECTCAMRASLDGRKCTTTITDCAEHGTSEAAIAERDRPEAIADLTLVIAHDYRDFIQWCYENDFNPRDPRRKFVRTEQDLRGLGWAERTIEVVITMRGYYRTDIRQIRGWLDAIRRSESQV